MRLPVTESILLAMWPALFCASSSAADVTPCPVPLSPLACYERYLHTLKSATHLQELHAFLTAQRVELIERSLEAVRIAGADSLEIERATLELLKQGSGGRIRLRAPASDATATLWVDRTEVTVEVQLVIERGGWRIADERIRGGPTGP